MDTLMHDWLALVIAAPLAVTLILLGYMFGTLVEITKGE